MREQNKFAWAKTDNHPMDGMDSSSFIWGFSPWPWMHPFVVHKVATIMVFQMQLQGVTKISVTLPAPLFRKSLILRYLKHICICQQTGGWPRDKAVLGLICVSAGKRKWECEYWCCYGNSNKRTKSLPNTFTLAYSCTTCTLIFWKMYSK